jgi:hypothetical protein
LFRYQKLGSVEIPAYAKAIDRNFGGYLGRPKALTDGI